MRPERTVHYVLAAGLTAALLTIRWLLQPALGNLQPYAPGIVAIAASVLLWGWRPAVLSTVVAYVGGTYLLAEPGGLRLTTSAQGLAALVIYGVSAGLIIFMGHRAHLAERRLVEANEHLREADRRKDHFLATLSHELRNPMGVIVGALATLDRHDLDARTRSTVALLGRQATQIQRLVEDLLDVGRITRGRMTLRPEPTDLRRCVEHAAEGCMESVGRKKQSLVVSLPHHPVALTVDAARMVQVLSNLIDNASKYSQAHADIRVNLAEEKATVVIHVSDDGPGIAPHVRPHVFDLFDQGGSSASDGLGLGLGLCKRIVEMHGGSIDAVPNPRGRGTSFVITLPRTQQT